MGLWEGIKRTFNIGGAKVGIFTASGSFSQGGEVNGQVLIKCGGYEISGNSIRILLEEFWQEQRGSGKNRHTVTVREPRDSVVFSRKFAMEKETEYAYQFTMKLPRNARLSTGSTGWSLLVSLDVPNAIDPEKRMVVKVGPAKEFLAVSKSCQDSMNFKEKESSWRWSSYNTCFRLLPPEDLKKEFDYISFELAQIGDGGVAGSVTFNLQEKFLKDYFKAMVGMDNITYKLSLGREELLKADGSVKSDAMSSKLRPLIQKIINDRDPYSKTY